MKTLTLTLPHAGGTAIPYKAVLFIGLLMSSGIQLNAQLPTAFQKVELVTGLKNSVNFEFSPDGRIFIVDRYGEIHIYNPTTQTTVSAGTFNVFHDMEEGLLALEFDPEFTSNQYIYLHYSHPTLPSNRVSRFTMNGDVIDVGSEVVVIQWTTDRNGYFHAAGDMEFDASGNLYIAVGDNTNHTAYAPLNEGDRNQSAERTSSNTNDLRGKILRIKINSSGQYISPPGNLFPNGVGGREEIYVMGARNPYRIFVDDTNTNWLFWGEVGPDANVESPNGPEGMDEINLVKNAGNYGWPYLAGKNEPYLNTYKQPNFYYDHVSPVNHSKWNTGALNLPAARPSWLDFFHGCYLAGPRYYFNSSITNPRKLPSDFNQGFFYFDFNTSKIWVVKMDGNGAILSNQRFAENVITGAGFIDMKIGPDGQMYILEYGAGCCSGNVGSGKLLRIDYLGLDPNKPPQVSLSTNKVSGPIPLTIIFSSEGTTDPDGDAVTYEWDFESDGTVDSTDPNPTFTYTATGTITALLRVTDSHGETIAKGATIYPGNTTATIQVNFPPDGGMFYWDDRVNYDFDIIDPEDGSTNNGSIDCSEVNFVPAFGHLNHSHDGLTINQCSGMFTLDPTSHDAQGQDNIYYIFKINYEDEGGLTVHNQITLYPKVAEAEFFNSQNNTKLVTNTDGLGGGVSSVRALLDNSYIQFTGRNLLNIDSVAYRLSSTVGGVIEVHADSLTGQLLSTIQIPVTGAEDRWTKISAPIVDPGGPHDLYFVFRRPGAINIVDLNYIHFKGAGISTDATPPKIYSVKVTSPNEVVVKFNEALEKLAATTVSNYSINNGIQISAVKLLEDKQTIRIQTSPMSIGVQNQLTISVIRNESGIALAGPITQAIALDQALVRINAGGPLEDFGGIQWLASKYNTGGTAASKPGLAIGNTTFDALYQTELNGNFTMNIPVSQVGFYDANLHFAETTYKNRGDRIFSVSIENNQYTLANYDLYAKAGYANATVERAENIKVSDGFLTITLAGIKNKAKLSALEVFYETGIALQPSILIINPANGLKLAQPVKVSFLAENWWIASGSSHVQLWIDGQFSSDIFDTKPITLPTLSEGQHVIRLVLVDANNVPSVSDQVSINIVDASSCIDNPFPSQWEQHVIGADLPYRSPQMFAADIDSDGFKDIVTGGWWFKNPGSMKGVWTRNTVGAPMNNMFLVHDLDKDGDLDLLGTNGAYLGTQLAWARNDGQGNFTIHTNIPQSAGFPPGSANNNTFLAGAAVGNFNNVPNIQIALVWNGSESTKAPVKMLTVPANPVTTTWVVADIAPNAVGETITAIDIDKDGDLDLSQAKNWLRNNGGTWTAFNTGITMPTYYEHHIISDFDRNGTLDGVFTQIGENQDVIWVQVAANPTALWSKSVLGSDVDSGLSLDHADLDFDGDLDVIVAEWKSEKRLLAFENDLCNSGNWIKTVLHPGGATGPDHHNSAQTADLDNDGDLDIISVGWDKRTPRIFINNSSTVSSNAAPVVAIPLPDQPAVVGVPLNFAITDSSFTDADGDILSLTAVLSNGAALPSWLSFVSSNRTFKGTPPAATVNLIIRVTAADLKGEKVFDDFMIVFTNTPPVLNIPLADLTSKAGDPFTFTFVVNTFTDGNGDALTYTSHLVNSTSLPLWLQFNAATRTFTGTSAIADIGIYQVQLNATDGQSTASDVFQITLTDPTANQAPLVANPISDMVATVGVAFAYTFPATTFNDADGDALTYVAVAPDSSQLPSWLDFDDSARTFSGLPTVGDVGTQPVKLYACDQNSCVSLLFTIIIEDGGSVRINSGGPAVSAVGSNFDADKMFVGGSVYSNTKITDIVGTTYDQLYKTERNKAFSYQIPVAAGTYLVRLHFAEIYFGATGGGTGGVGSRIFNVTAEGAALLTNFDIFSEVGAMRALIKEFDVNVSDGLLNINFVTVKQSPKVSAIEVIAKSTSTNSPPVVSSPIPDQVGTHGSSFNFAFNVNTFSDPNGDPLDYSATLANGSPLPSWLSFSGEARTFTGTLPTAQTIAILVSASDGQGGSVNDSFYLTIEDNTIPSVRINAGGAQYTSPSIGLFSADKNFNGGSVYTNNNITDISGTSDDMLYKSERYKMTGYNIPVSAGTYTLRLHFAEIYFGASGGGAGGSGKRVFSVTAEGQTILNNFDIFAEAGAMAAITKTFDISVTDGTLNLVFIKVIDNPKISAIEVVPASTSASSMDESSISIFDDQEEPGFRVYPNPVKQVAVISYTPARDTKTLLQLVNMQGAMVETIFSGALAEGQVRQLEFEVSHLTSGVYFVRLQTDSGTFFKRIVVAHGD